MKIFISTLVIIVAILAGYILGSFFPFNFSNISFQSDSDKGIQGDAQLIITAKMDNGKNIIPNLEIDLAEEPGGQPPEGGVALTDTSGVAEFNVKPGIYYIYFNDLNFPTNLKNPGPEQITVSEDAPNTKEILFVTK